MYSSDRNVCIISNLFNNNFLIKFNKNAMKINYKGLF